MHLPYNISPYVNKKRTTDTSRFSFMSSTSGYFLPDNDVSTIQLSYFRRFSSNKVPNIISKNKLDLVGKGL